MELPVEAQLLLLCARARLDSDGADAAHRLAAREDFDWDRFMRLLKQHGLVPCIRARLYSNELRVAPQDIRTELNERSRAVAFRNLHLVGELLRLDEIFSQAGMNVVWFKGPVLASQAYGNVGMRQFGDLDVLIPRERAVEVNRIFQQQGYASRYNLVSPERQRLLERVSNEHVFGNSERQIFVDVHWSLTECDYSFSPRAPMATKEIELVGRRVMTFDTEATLSYLCYHGCKHGWASFNSILDVAEFVRNNPNLAWETLTTTSHLPIGALRMLRLGLALAHIGAGVPLPQSVIEWIECDGRVPALAERILMHCLVSPKPFRTHVYLAAMESWVDRARHLVSIVWRPSALEIERVMLPDNLFFLYSGLRFVRLVRKYVLRASGPH
jgi:hypothetical protein